MAEATVRTRRASFFGLTEIPSQSQAHNAHFFCFADGNDERCVIRALRPLYASTSEYSVEYCCDYLSIGSTRYQGSQNAPHNVQMAAHSIRTFVMAAPARSGEHQLDRDAEGASQ